MQTALFFITSALLSVLQEDATHGHVVAVEALLPSPSPAAGANDTNYGAK